VRVFNLNMKLWLSLVAIWLGLILLGGWAALESRNTMLSERKGAVQDVVEAAYSIVDDYAKQADSRKLTLDQAQQRAKDKLAVIRYPHLGYVIVTTGQPKVIMHPMLADLRDKDVSDYKDINGKFFFVEMVELARAQGQGFVENDGRLPNNGGTSHKVSFGKHFAPWDWYLISGLYTNDIKAAFYANLSIYAAVVLVIGGVISLGMILIIRNVKRSLGGEPAHTVQIAARIAGGDLTGAIVLREGDHSSMLYAMQDMQRRLNVTIRTIRRGTESISQAAQEISASNLDLSSRTEQQAASLGETAASMEQLTSTVKQNADNARQANQMAASASQIAGEGGAVVQQVVDTMQHIAASSTRIVDIISVIEGIAFQTNILALNAAVEAARAGGQGRGFAVVAGEVRNLAQRSSDAAKEIKGLIESSVSQIDDGRTLVEQAGTTMVSIVQAVQRVTDIIGEISAASSEQSRGIEQVNIAITQMDTTTQQNAAMVEQAAAAARSMEEQSLKLRETVGVFRLTGVDRTYV